MEKINNFNENKELNYADQSSFAIKEAFFDLVNKLKRGARIAVAGLGIVMSAEVNAVFSAEKSLKDQEISLLGGSVDTSKYTLEELPHAKKEKKSFYVNFTDYERQALKELKDAAKSRKLNLKTDEMTKEKVDEWYAKVENRIDEVEKDRNELESLKYSVYDDPRVTPIIESVLETMGVESNNIKNIPVDVKSISEDALPDSQFEALTDETGHIYLSSRSLISIVNTQDPDHTKAILTLMNELTHGVRHKQFSDKDEPKISGYDKVYLQAAKENVLPPGYISPEILNPEAFDFYKKWLEDIYKLRANDKEIMDIIDLKKKELDTDPSSNDKKESLALWERLQQKDKARWLQEMESFVVPYLTLQKIKQKGLHYRVPKGLPFKMMKSGE